MMKLRTILLATMTVAACSSATPQAACKAGPSTTRSVELGFGKDSFTPATADQETTIISGPQGGQHVWTGVLASGFDPSSVTITLDAVDAFSGLQLCHSDNPDVALNPVANDLTSCEYTGLYMYLKHLDRRANSGLGLANITATVTDGANRTASTTSRAWIGMAMLDCIPQTGVTPSLLVLYDIDSAPGTAVVQDGTTLSSLSVTPGFVTLEFETNGLAASNATVTVTLTNPQADGGGPLLSKTLAAPDGSQFPSIDPGPPSRCNLNSSLQIPITRAGQPLHLEVQVDDGLGHKAEAVYQVTFSQ